MIGLNESVRAVIQRALGVAASELEVLVRVSPTGWSHRLAGAAAFRLPRRRARRLREADPQTARAGHGLRRRLLQPLCRSAELHRAAPARHDRGRRAHLFHRGSHAGAESGDAGGERYAVESMRPARCSIPCCWTCGRRRATSTRRACSNPPPRCCAAADAVFGDELMHTLARRPSPSWNGRTAPSCAPSSPRTTSPPPTCCTTASRAPG